MIEINWLAVFVSSLVSFAIGAVWFGPKTFYPVWIRALGREVPTERVEMKKGETALMFGGTYVGALAQVVTLAVIIALARAVAPGFGWSTGAAFGFFLSVGFGAFASRSPTAATSAARIACLRQATCGYRERTCSRSRRSRAWSTSCLASG